MTSKQIALKTSIRRWTLILGVAQITFGCVVGFIPPTAVPWFRGIVMAHIEFTANGVLSIALGLLVDELALGAQALRVWFVALQVGTWMNGMAGLVGGILGFSSVLMTTINQKFPAPGGPEHAAVTGLLKLCGVAIMIALLMTLYGLCRPQERK